MVGRGNFAWIEKTDRSTRHISQNGTKIWLIDSRAHVTIIKKRKMKQLQLAIIIKLVTITFNA